MNTIHIFSPHIDDAFLSLGGSILKWRQNNINVNIYNVFSISDWVNPNNLNKLDDYNKIDLHTVTLLRKNEEIQVVQSINAIYEFWDFLDLPLRENFSNDEYKLMEADITNKISKCLNDYDHYFFPWGKGHPDHVIINNISKTFLNKGLNIFYFEDMPYFSFGNFDYQSCIPLESKKNIPIAENIDFEKKMGLLKRYSTQLNDLWLNSIRAYSYNVADNVYYERYWKVQ